MSYIDAAKKDGRPTWFVFRGQTDDGVTVTPVAWATRALAEVGQQVEPRLRLPSGLVRTMPQTIGGAPVACSVTIALENADGAERSLIIGSTSSDPADEYSEGSVYNLSGVLYHAVQDEDGTIYEQALTPTLHLAGSPVYADEAIQLPMSSDDEELLGPSRFAWTLDSIKNSEPGTDGVAPGAGVEIDAEYMESDGTSATLSQSEITIRFRLWNEGLDVPARFAYSGGQPMELVRVRTEQGGGKDKSRGVTFFCFVALLEPDVSSFPTWGVSLDKVSDLDEPTTVGGHRLIKAARWLQDLDGDWKLVWVVFMQQDFLMKDVPSNRLYQDQQFWITGMPPSQGLASHNPPPPKSEYGTPAYVIRRLISDHARLWLRRHRHHDLRDSAARRFPSLTSVLASTTATRRCGTSSPTSPAPSGSTSGRVPTAS
jgi:hypothetical protein